MAHAPHHAQSLPYSVLLAHFVPYRTLLTHRLHTVCVVDDGGVRLSGEASGFRRCLLAACVLGELDGCTSLPQRGRLRDGSTGAECGHTALLTKESLLRDAAGG